MKVAKQSQYIRGTEDKDKHLIEVDNDLRNLFLAMQSRIRFGAATDGNDGENIAGEFQVITTNATPDTEDAFAHGLGSVPIGYLVLSKDKAGHIYDGSTSWTSTNIYLRSDVATVAAVVFLIK